MCENGHEDIKVGEKGPVSIAHASSFHGTSCRAPSHKLGHPRSATAAQVCTAANLAGDWQGTPILIGVNLPLRQSENVPTVLPQSHGALEPQFRERSRPSPHRAQMTAEVRTCLKRQNGRLCARGRDQMLACQPLLDPLVFMDSPAKCALRQLGPFL